MASNVREHIITTVKEELIGPSSSLTLSGYEDGYDIPYRETPRSRYGTGILFPQKSLNSLETEASDKVDDIDTPFDGDETINFQEPLKFEEGNGKGASDTEYEHELTLANEYLPSAMGFSCLVDSKCEVDIKLSGAYYTPIERNKNKSNWKRNSFAAQINLTSNDLSQHGAKEYTIETGESEPGLVLHVFVRPSPLEKSKKSDKIITFTLLNNKLSTASSPKDVDCYFQCSFEASGCSNELPFLEYPEEYFKNDSLTDEELEMQLLYRNHKVFAVGHGCSVDWSAKIGNERSKSINTTSLPEYEIFPVVPTSFSDINLKMWYLGNESKVEVVKELDKLINEYRAWINNRNKEALSISERLKPAALKNIKKCNLALTRMENGVNVLKNDNSAWLSFQYMNRAMLMQYCHYRLSSDPRKWIDKHNVSKKYTKPNYDLEGDNRSWRPFQIAFILMSLDSSINETSLEREVVDVIWFPTGGGKTEAYLGLAALTIFYKRMKAPNLGGVTAIMRYTLRLLTTQQFQRAASLICAMDLLREENKILLGDKEITIGLWVGSKVTPNKEKDAKADLSELIRRPDSTNRFVIKSCPWCGCEMGPVFGTLKGYKKIRNKVRHQCEDEDCNFYKKNLPVQIIDEHIYDSPPTLLIGTVDKFSMLPWIPEAKSLFGLAKGCQSASLIIQDELHLISGPLGSMVGLYETVIDALCQRGTVNKIKPKIVASTATVSNAQNQIEKLFGREHSTLFPPQGLQAGDSFFAKESKNDNGRKYVGIFATGLSSQMTAMVRVLSTLIQSPLIGKFTPEEIDPYWTSLIYFNSVRELGHASTLLRGDVPEYLNVMSNVRLKIPKDDPRKRYIKNGKELTSRISSDHVFETLQELFNKHYQSNNSIDTCLATNMIQVGLDVDRLALMLIAGQPKTTSEYIQASSRVGRDKNSPGLVFVLLNPARSRDRSHYESFKAFHQSFYKYVEPSSVTPFAVPVRDRALHAIVITLVRYLGTDDNRSEADSHISAELKDEIDRIILDRVELVDPNELASTKAQLKNIWDTWNGSKAKYGKINGDMSDDALMIASSSDQNLQHKSNIFLVPTSMRNVDATCEVNIINEYQYKDK